MVNSPTFVGRARRSESRFCADLGCPEGFGGGWGVHEALEGFVTNRACLHFAHRVAGGRRFDPLGRGKSCGRLIRGG